MTRPHPGGGNTNQANSLKPEKPKNIKEIPRYLWEIISGFFYRLFYIFKLVWEARPALLFIMLFMSIFNGVMPVIGARISADLLNSLANPTGTFTNREFSSIGKFIIQLTKATETGNSWHIIMALLILQFSYNLFNALVSSVYNMFVSISGEIVTNYIKVKIITKAKEVDIASFDLPEFYEKLENANREAGMRPINIMRSTFSLFSTLISMVSFIVILITVRSWMPLVFILLAISYAIINFTYRRKTFFYMRRRSKDRRQMDYYSNLLVNKDIVKEIRLFGLSSTFITRFKNMFKIYYAGIKRLIINENIWHITLSVISATVNCFLYLFLARKVFEGVFFIGDYSLYTSSLSHISGSVSAIIGITSSIYEGSLFIDNMIAFMSVKKKIVPIIDKPRHVKRYCGHTIEFKNVSFSYPGTDRKVLKNINLKINAGDTCVLVGLNGAGKTTLIKLLTRLYDPTEGVILLDGHDIREYDVDELYQMFGIIFQDFGKYAVSVSENIEFGDILHEHENKEQDIVRAAQQSSADVFIEQLPNKYDTPLMRYFEENGIELSIGQWQKLSIARAFYSDSDFLILDEPTASLDAIAEQEIFNQFDNLRKNKTTIFVSHRLSSATVASKIVVLENGEIIEEGNHSQLMNLKGRYYELFTTQAKRYMTEVDENDVLDENMAAHTRAFGAQHGVCPCQMMSQLR
jgi:ABC-type multidrug transport system fused ATPase/permease subunit